MSLLIHLRLLLVQMYAMPCAHVCHLNARRFLVFRKISIDVSNVAKEGRQYAAVLHSLTCAVSLLPCEGSLAEALCSHVHHPEHVACDTRGSTPRPPSMTAIMESLLKQFIF